MYKNGHVSLGITLHTTPPTSYSVFERIPNRKASYGYRSPLKSSRTQQIKPFSTMSSTETAWCKRCKAYMSLGHINDKSASHGSIQRPPLDTNSGSSSSSIPSMKRENASVGQSDNKPLTPPQTPKFGS